MQQNQNGLCPLCPILHKDKMVQIFQQGRNKNLSKRFSIYYRNSKSSLSAWEICKTHLLRARAGTGLRDCYTSKYYNSGIFVMIVSTKILHSYSHLIFSPRDRSWGTWQLLPSTIHCSISILSLWSNCIFWFSKGRKNTGKFYLV